MKNTISYQEQTCEDLNNRGIKIFNNQIKLVEQMSDKCKNRNFWEDLDVVLKHYYYDQGGQDEDLKPFDLNMIKKKFKCKECYDQWSKYIDMEDQRFRLDLKKQKCYRKLQVLENNEEILNKFI